MKRPQTMWDDGAWWVFIPGKSLFSPRLLQPGDWVGQWVRYDALCDTFPGFKEIYTPEPDEPQS